MPPPDRSSWTVAQLRKELAARGARVSGRKSELVQRLDDYDRNQDFAGPSVPIPDISPMPIWPKGTFKSLTEADRELLPAIPKECIEKYIKFRQANDK